MPRLLLIEPRNKNKKFWQRSKVRRFPSLGCQVIAAVTPDNWDVEFVDEECGETVDWSRHYDLVGIGAMTSQVTRGYDVADRFRREGVPVVFGGSHATVMPDEALLHCDSVVVGEGERVWPGIVRDFERGGVAGLQKKYRGPAPDDWYVAPRRDLVKGKGLFGVAPVVATRGCPYTCSFCSVFTVFGRGYRHRAVDDVVREVAQLRAQGQKWFVFVDDNIIGNAKWSKELFRKLAPLDITWGGQTTLGVARDPEVLELARKSGCLSMFVGVESVSKESLRGVRKQFNKTDRYREQCRVFHDNGIVIIAGMIFGFDEDDEFCFERSVEAADRLGIGVGNFSVLTPLPGTDTFEELERQGRILFDDWARFDGSQVVFRPKRMTVEQLQEGVNWAGREYYRLRRIFGRLKHNRMHAHYYLPLALSYKLRHYEHGVGWARRLPDADKVEMFRELGFDEPAPPDARAAQPGVFNPWEDLKESDPTVLATIDPEGKLAGANGTNVIDPEGKLAGANGTNGAAASQHVLAAL